MKNVESDINHTHWHRTCTAHTTCLHDARYTSRSTCGHTQYAVYTSYIKYRWSLWLQTAGQAFPTRSAGMSGCSPKQQPEWTVHSKPCISQWPAGQRSWLHVPRSAHFQHWCQCTDYLEEKRWQHVVVTYRALPVTCCLWNWYRATDNI